MGLVPYDFVQDSRVQRKPLETSPAAVPPSGIRNGHAKILDTELSRPACRDLILVVVTVARVCAAGCTSF